MPFLREYLEGTIGKNFFVDAQSNIPVLDALRSILML